MGSSSSTPERRRGDKAGEEQALQAERARLHQVRESIARASGRVEQSEPLLLCNLAAPLANTERQLAVMHR